MEKKLERLEGNRHGCIRIGHKLTTSMGMIDEKIPGSVLCGTSFKSLFTGVHAVLMGVP